LKFPDRSPGCIRELGRIATPGEEIKLQRSALGYFVSLSKDLIVNCFVLVRIKVPTASVKDATLSDLPVFFVNLRSDLHRLIRRNASGNRQIIVLIARNAIWIRRCNLKSALTPWQGARRRSSLLPLPCSKRMKRFLPLHLKASPGNIKLHLSDVSVLLLLSRLNLAKVFGNAAK
jgi:hypothetical protein